MKSLIEQLYYGDINPSLKENPVMEAYEKKKEELVQRETELMKKLDTDLKMELDALTSEFYAFMPDEIVEAFAEGFSMGVKLMAEALYI